MVEFWFSETITYNGEELEVSGYAYPPDSETNTPRTMEIESVIYKGIDVWNILETATEGIEELLWKKLDERAESAAEDRAEAQIEAKKEWRG